MRKPTTTQLPGALGVGDTGGLIKVDQGVTAIGGHIIPPSTAKNSGVMTSTQAGQLAALVAGGGGGAMQWTVTATQVAGDTFTAAANDFVPVDATAGDVGVVLPTAVGISGKVIAVKDVGGSATAAGIKVTTADGQTIDGQSSWTLANITGGTTDFGCAVFVSNGANWLIGYVYSGRPNV